jgi:hypothetical protein
MSDHADSETAEAVPGSATAATEPAPPGARRARLAAYVTAAVLILGGGFGIVTGTPSPESS